MLSTDEVSHLCDLFVCLSNPNLQVSKNFFLNVQKQQGSSTLTAKRVSSLRCLFKSFRREIQKKKKKKKSCLWFYLGEDMWIFENGLYKAIDMVCIHIHSVAPRRSSVVYEES